MIQTLRQLNKDYSIRAESYHGKTHLVVPVVMMVEGVHAGSLGPLYHSAEELGKYPDAWNGIPITVQHPQRDGAFISANSPDVLEESVGRVFNAHMDGAKLKAEAWLDEEQLMEMETDVLAYIRDGKPLEVSVGVFNDMEETPGEWQGEQYAAIARNHRPDHLALLPGEEGACSWADGCGIRLNHKQKGEEHVKTQKSCEVLLTNQKDYTELQSAIQNKLNGMDSGGEYYYLRALYDDAVVYEVSNRDGSSYYKRNYSINDDGTVEFAESKQSVKKVVEYVNSNKAVDGATVHKRTAVSKNKKQESMSNEVKTCCPENVDALIANERSKFTVDDKEWLLTLSADALAKLEPEEVKEPKTPEAPEINAAQAMAVLKESISKPEEFINLMPTEMQESMKSGMAMHKAHRTTLIANIVANNKDVWTEEELQAMDTDMLTKINKSVGKVIDYSPMGGNAAEVEINASTEEPMFFPDSVVPTAKK